MQRISACFVLSCLLVVSLGCGSGSNEPPLAVVEGKVAYKGEPLKSGTVTFAHELGRPYSGDIGADGTYKLKAAQGACKVTIESREPGKEAKPGLLMPGKSLIPEKYGAVSTSGLTFEIKPGTNKADFDLVP